jgi:catechol 2,3-dioxygenase-like lactoylglutathione lyase family enzyme
MKEQPMDINGMAHVILTVSNFEASLPFYRKLLPFLGMKPVINGKDMFYCVGGRTALGIMPSEEKYSDEKFVQRRVGLHHLCFRARTREDIDAAYEALREFGAKIVHRPEEGSWAPGYYSVLFEDPDGIRLEFNFVPGKGLLAEK